MYVGSSRRRYCSLEHGSLSEPGTAVLPRSSFSWRGVPCCEVQRYIPPLTAAASLARDAGAAGAGASATAARCATVGDGGCLLPAKEVSHQQSVSLFTRNETLPSTVPRRRQLHR